MKLKKKYSLKELAKRYNCKIAKQSDFLFDNISSLNNIKPRSLIYLVDKRLLSQIDNNADICLITTNALSDHLSHPHIISDNPLLTFSIFLHDYINDNNISFFKKNDAIIYPKSTLIHKNVSIGDFVDIGKNCLIYPNVTIYDNSIIGDNVIIHSGAVIGSDGFGLVRDTSSLWQKVPQIGNVIIGDNVEIGSNTSIDRAAIDSTIIGKNVKIDNQVQIAHNVEVGENTAIAACVGIAGSTRIGKNCTIGGGSGINGHINICDNVHINGMTMVTKSITEPGSYASGTTVQDVNTWRKNQARFKNLDQIIKTIKSEEKKDE